jgi:hypothetical protein
MGKGYDVEGWKSTGLPATYNPEDKKMHTGSINPKTGEVLKGRAHKTWNLHEITEAAMGAKPMMIKGRYHSVGSGPVDVKPKSDVEIKTKGKRDFKKQQYMDSITPKNRG